MDIKSKWSRLRRQRRRDELNWKKGSDSQRTGNCVEVAETEGGVLVRDSKHPNKKPLSFTKAEFSAWLNGAKSGEFDNMV